MNKFPVKILLSVWLIALPCGAAIIGENANTLDSGILRVYPGPISAKLNVEYGSGKARFVISITNSSKEFFCMSAKMTNPIYQHILFRKITGELVGLRTVGDSSPEANYKFDYDDTYMFIKPNESKKIVRDFNNFDIGAGSYVYEITFLYYKCKDIIDPERAAKQKSIRIYLAHGGGKFALP